MPPPNRGPGRLLQRYVRCGDRRRRSGGIDRMEGVPNSLLVGHQTGYETIGIGGRAQHLQQGRSDCRRIRVRGDRQIAFERREVTIRFFEISASCTVKYRRSIFEHTA